MSIFELVDDHPKQMQPSLGRVIPDHPNPITQIDATTPTKQHRRDETKGYPVSQPLSLHRSQPENERSPWKYHGQHCQQRQTEKEVVL
ncbi:unnamed protein product [Malus baccata var. baccata]